MAPKFEIAFSAYRFFRLQHLLLVPSLAPSKMLRKYFSLSRFDCCPGSAFGCLATFYVDRPPSPTILLNLIRRPSVWPTVLLQALQRHHPVMLLCLFILLILQTPFPSRRFRSPKEHLSIAWTFFSVLSSTSHIDLSSVPRSPTLTYFLEQNGFGLLHWSL